MITSPGLRFSGFDNEWICFNLGDKYDVRDGTHDSPKYITNGGYPLITSKNLSPDGSIDFSNISYISESDYDAINRRSSVSVGDILFGMIGTIGNPVLLKSDGFAIKNVALIKPVDISTSLLIHYFRTSAIEKQFHQKNAGGTQKFISLGDIRGLTIRMPESIQEQEKIAEFLTAVDERINLASRKVEKLETYKRGLTQKIFTRTLRFKRDDGSDFPEWEEKKIFDIAVIKKGTQLNKDSMISEGFPVINGGVEPSGYTDSFNTEEGSITISEGGNSCGFVNYINEKFWSGGHCYVVTNKDNTNKLFLLQMLKFQQSDIMKLRVGSGLPNIQKKDLEGMRVSVPSSIVEQQKIATFLSQIDKKITLETGKLEELKKFKKALLQRMFV